MPWFDSISLGPSEITPLYAACNAERYNHTDVVQLLLECGADPNMPCSSNGDFSMHVACLNRHVDAIRLLLLAGCPVDDDAEEDGDSPRRQRTWNAACATQCRKSGMSRLPRRPKAHVDDAKTKVAV